MAAPLVMDSRTTRLVLLAALLHGLAYFFAVAPWMGEDEPWNLEYATHVSELHRPWGGRKATRGEGGTVDERRLWATSALQMRQRVAGVSDEALAARQREILDSMEAEQFFRRVDWAGGASEHTDFDQIEPFFTASTHPPVYYTLLGVWLAPLRQMSIEAKLLWGRAFSLGLYVLTVWIALQLACAAFSDRSLALAATLAFAWLPINARQAAIVNSDVLARTMGVLVLCLCARCLVSEHRRSAFVWAAIFTAVGLLVKSTTASSIAALYVTLLLQPKILASRVRLVLFLVGSVVALAAVVLIWHTQHSPVLPRNFPAFVERVSRGLSLETFGDLGRKFIGAFNWNSREMSSSTYVVAAAIAGLGLLSGFSALLHTRRGVSRPVLAVCLATVGFQLVLVVLRGAGEGRYLMPVLGALAVIFAVGCVAPFSEFRRPTALRLFATLLLVYDAVFLWGGLVPNEFLLWGS